MFSKDDILKEIKRTAEENGGKPLGVLRFEKEVSINEYNWGKYWARFGDAQKEAGFIPNQLQSAHADKFLFEKLIGLTRKLDKFPTHSEINAERNNDPELPDKGSFYRLGTKKQMATKVMEYCANKTNCNDVVKICQSIVEKPDEGKSNDKNIYIGEVYLFKSGRYYKIGKTKDTVRRGSELRIQLPEKMDLVHAIKTDDPTGIEAYWHKRFEDKRKQGEWFDLNSSDVRAFRRWRKII